jgi:hypothetical protein
MHQTDGKGSTARLLVVTTNKSYYYLACRPSFFLEQKCGEVVRQISFSFCSITSFLVNFCDDSLTLQATARPGKVRDPHTCQHLAARGDLKLGSEIKKRSRLLNPVRIFASRNGRLC